MVVPRPGSCPHEIRPGTTICLHCRREERLARTERRRRTATRIGVGIASLAVCAVVANAAAGAFGSAGLPKLSALTGGRGSGHARPRAATVRHDDAGAPTSTEPASTPTYGATEATQSISGAAPSAVAATAATRPTAAPIVAEGRNALRGSAVAVRAGDIVTVQFDAPETRTRRADKFESIVRVTLPEIYGAAADSALAHVPAGTMVAPGATLVTDLPARGVRLPIAAAPGAAGAIMLWPETRPGRDGPLVVSYRATVVP